MEKDEKNIEQFEIIQDIKTSGMINDAFAIPSADEIIQLESYSPDEMADMMRQYNGLNFKMNKAFQEELDGVVHPNDDYSSSGAHHQPHFTQAGDLEYSVREMFKEYKFQKYNPDHHVYDPLDANATLYNMNTYHEFEGCLSYDLFSFKLLSYYTRLYRIFKLEYFICKTSAKTLDILHLERYVYNGADYWRMTEKAEIPVNNQQDNFEIFSDSDDIRADQNKVSKGIIKQIVTSKRRRTQLQDNLESFYLSMMEFKHIIDNLPEKSMDTILEYSTITQDNRFFKIIYCLDQTIDKILNRPKLDEISTEEENKIMVQVHSLQSLKTKLANRDKKYIPWFNYRYFKNYTEYFKTTKSVLNDEAMSPEQIDILKEKYPTIIFSKNVFPGQKICQPNSCLDYELLDLSQDVKSYIASSSCTIKGFIHDYLEVFKL